MFLEGGIRRYHKFKALGVARALVLQGICSQTVWPMDDEVCKCFTMSSFDLDMQAHPNEIQEASLFISIYSPLCTVLLLSYSLKLVSFYLLIFTFSYIRKSLFSYILIFLNSRVHPLAKRHVFLFGNNPDIPIPVNMLCYTCSHWRTSGIYHIVIALFVLLLSVQITTKVQTPPQHVSKFNLDILHGLPLSCLKMSLIFSTLPLKFFLYDTYFTYKAKHLNAYVCKIIFFQKTCEHLPVHSSLSSFGWKAACHTCLVVSFLNVVFSKPMKKQSLCEQRWAIFEHASQEQVLYVNTRGLLHLPIL